jgi:uncharacterized protein YndB with AHSA1/START domain
MSDPGGRSTDRPTGRRAYEVVAESAAPVESVWPLLAEARRWKEWSFLTRTGLEREGDPAPDGVGAVRRFTAFGMGSREEVVAWEPPHHLGYTILSGFPVRNYRSDVVLTPNGTGTTVTWRGTYDERFPGTGPLLDPFLRSLMRRFATGVARAAERSPHAASGDR